MAIKSPALYIYTLLILSACMGLLEAAYGYKGAVFPQTTVTLWGVTSVFLTVIWAYYDAEAKRFDKPYDFGFLEYLFWPVALPWYLVKTRGVEGWLIFAGFLALIFGPWVIGLISWVYFSPDL